MFWPGQKKILVLKDLIYSNYERNQLNHEILNTQTKQFM